MRKRKKQEPSILSGKVNYDNLSLRPECKFCDECKFETDLGTFTVLTSAGNFNGISSINSPIEFDKAEGLVKEEYNIDIEALFHTESSYYFDVFEHLDNEGQKNFLKFLASLGYYFFAGAKFNDWNTDDLSNSYRNASEFLELLNEIQYQYAFSNLVSYDFLNPEINIDSITKVSDVNLLINQCHIFAFNTDSGDFKILVKIGDIVDGTYTPYPYIIKSAKGATAEILGIDLEIILNSRSLLYKDIFLHLDGEGQNNVIKILTVIGKYFFASAKDADWEKEELSICEDEAMTFLKPLFIGQDVYSFIR